MRTVTLVLLLALAACGSDTGQVTGEGESNLTVTLDDGAGQVWTWTLTCDPPGGNHPDPGAACAALAAARAPFAPVPKDMLCTQVYGGPETATITGTWRGAPVDASYSRIDGCEIARWQAIAAVLAASGASP